MEHSDKIAQRIIDKLPTTTSKNLTISMEMKVFAVDFAKMCKNIKETSAGYDDMRSRALQLSEESGIDAYYIKQLVGIV